MIFWTLSLGENKTQAFLSNPFLRMFSKGWSQKSFYCLVKEANWKQALAYLHEKIICFELAEKSWKKSC